jgi:hypothetical protein
MYIPVSFRRRTSTDEPEWRLYTVRRHFVSRVTVIACLSAAGRGPPSACGCCRPRRTRWRSCPTGCARWPRSTTGRQPTPYAWRANTSCAKATTGSSSCSAEQVLYSRVPPIDAMAGVGTRPLRTSAGARTARRRVCRQLWRRHPPSLRHPRHARRPEAKHDQVRADPATERAVPDQGGRPRSPRAARSPPAIRHRPG